MNKHRVGHVHPLVLIELERMRALNSIMFNRSSYVLDFSGDIDRRFACQLQSKRKVRSFETS